MGPLGKLRQTHVVTSFSFWKSNISNIRVFFFWGGGELGQRVHQFPPPLVTYTRLAFWAELVLPNWDLSLKIFEKELNSFCFNFDNIKATKLPTQLYYKHKTPEWVKFCCGVRFGFNRLFFFFKSFLPHLHRTLSPYGQWKAAQPTTNPPSMKNLNKKKFYFHSTFLHQLVLSSCSCHLICFYLLICPNT